MTIAISAETERRLQAEASRRGVPADQLAEQLLDAVLAEATHASPNQSSIDILNAWESESATNDAAEITRRQREFEHFKRELNQTRIETDGRGARIPFP